MDNNYDDSGYEDYEFNNNTETHQDKDTIMHPVAYRGFSANSLITFNSFIQEKKDKNKIFVTDVIFVVFREGNRSAGKTQYNKNTEIKIKFDAIEIRAFAYGIYDAIKSKGNVKEGEVLYKKNTASAETQIAYSQGTFYINCIKYDTKKKIGVAFDIHSFLSFSDTLKKIADLTESFLYKYQRELKK